MAIATTKKVALVSGSSSGFGLLTAIELARQGFHVYDSMRSPQRAERFDQAVAKADVTLEKIALDVTDEVSIRAAVDHILRAEGRIDVLVNNAGFGMGGCVEDFEMAELRSQFETNFFGVVALTKAVLTAMRAQKSGRIINVSSIGGLVTTQGFGAYCASKFAVEGFSEALRHEMLSTGVFVTLIEPGTFRTEIFERNAQMAVGAKNPNSPNYARTMYMEALILKQVTASTANPQKVADAVARAATASRPGVRYRVGVDAKAMYFLYRFLPWRLWELAYGAIFSAPKTGPKSE